MDPIYALTRLYSMATAARTAAKAYYACKGDPRVDKLKQEHLAESKRRESDLDGLLETLPKVFPQVLADTKGNIPAGALEISEMNTIRLDNWKDKLNIKEASALIVVGVGLKGDNAGKLVVLCTSDHPVETHVLNLQGAIRQLQRI